MNNVLITIGVLIVAVLSALFAVPYFVDWNTYRGVVEEEVSRVVGRDVRIGGDITLQLLPAPAFGIQKLRVADAATGSGEPLFRADRVEARLSIVPLVRGVLEANQIELVKPVLRFVIDDNGQGNWRSLVQGHGSLPFSPNNVALQAVKITDGSFSLFDRSGNRLRVGLDHIEGQLSAPALEGPYRFRGIFGDKPEQRDLRFTTLPPDGDGVVQIKGSLKDLASNATATLDAKVRDLGSQPTLTGELSALLPMPAAAEPSADATVQTAKRAPTPMADLKSTITASARQLAFGPLSLAFESSGRPEVLSGEATIDWSAERTIVAKLAAPWIDLDNVLGNPQGGNPLLALGDFAQRINGLGSSLGATSAVLQIDQANLGHDLIGGIRIEARSSGGSMAVEQLHANLPGSTKVEMRGRIAGEGGSTTFDGDMTVRGNSIARLIGWASAGGTTIDPANDAGFGLRSRVTAEPARGGLRDIVAEVGDSTLEGEIDYAWRGARKLRVTVGGSRIDARTLFPARLDLRSMISALTPATAAKPGAGAASPSGLAIALNLKAAELVLPDQTLRDVAAVMETTTGGLAIDRLQFSADHGVALSLEGQLGASDAVRGSMSAGDVDGAKKLSDILGLPLMTMLPQSLLPDFLPITVAISSAPDSGVAGPGRTTIVDGRAGRADVKVRLALAGTLDDWRTKAADVDVVLLAPQDAGLAAKVLAALRGASAEPIGDFLAPTQSASDTSVTPVSRLALRATGIAANGLSTAVRFDSPDLSLFIDGVTRAPAADAMQLTGDVTLDARDVRSALDSMGGLSLALANPLSLQGTARLDAKGGAVGLDKIAVTTGAGAKVSGHLELSAPQRVAEAATPTRRLTGALEASVLDVASLLAPVLQRRPAETQAAIQLTSGRSGLWPDANFDFGRNRSGDATLSLKAARLVIDDGVTVTNAGLTLVGRPGAIELRDITGTALGGRLRASVVLDANPTGAALTGTFDIADLTLGPFGGTGVADLTLSLTGGGINPAGLVSGLTGKGTLKLGTATLREITPATLQAAIDTALKAPADAINGTLRTALAEDAARGTVAIGPRSIALTVQDGAVRMAPLALTAAPGRVMTSAALDLATFGISGDWRVETRAPPLPALPPVPVLPPLAGQSPQPVPAPIPVPAAMLPPLVQRFAISPVDLGATRRSKRPLPETDALERELSVRKVERDLAELERLRRLDEERIAQRALEEKLRAEEDAAREAVNKALVAPDRAAAPTPQ